MLAQNTETSLNSTPITATPCEAPLGAVIGGIDTRLPQSVERIRSLKKLIAEYGCIVIRDQHLNEEQHVAFAESFGSTKVPWLNAVELNTLARIKELPGRPGYTGIHPGSVYFVNGPQYRDEPDDGYLQGWHADMTHLQVPLPYATLCALEAPDYGYETWLSDQNLAYENLDQETKQRVDQLNIIHSFQHVFPNLPKVILPVVLKHPISGKRSIYGIPGVAEAAPMDVTPDEGARLMQKLTEHLESGRFIYKHVWKKGDVMIWDNRCVLHRRGPQAKGQTRILRRIMAADGDPPTIRNQLMGN